MGFGFVSFAVKRKSPSAAVSRSVILLSNEAPNQGKIVSKNLISKISPDSSFYTKIS